MSSARNIVVADFGHLPKTPTPAKVSKFILSALGVSPDILLSIQINNGRGCALMEFADPAIADEVSSKNQRFSIDGNKIPIYVDDQITEVHVHDLPIGLENNEIVNALACFGEVLMISNDRWKNFFPGLPNGVRVLKMKLSHPVPKNIMVANLKATIIYKGQNASWRLSKKKKNKRSSNNNNAKTCSYKKQPTAATSNSSTNNKNNNKASISKNLDQTAATSNSSTNNNNKETTSKNHDQTTATTSNNNNNNDGAKDQRKTLKRQHSKEEDIEGKMTGPQKADFFYNRYKEAKNKMTLAVDEVSKQQAKRLRDMYKAKLGETINKLDEDDKVKLVYIDYYEYEDSDEDL